MSHRIADTSILLDDHARTFVIKRGDTAPKLVAELLGVDINADPVPDAPVPVALDLATAVYFIMAMDGETYIKRTCEVANQETNVGQITFAWQTGDTAFPGTYNCEFEVHWIDGTKNTFPADDTFTVVVTQDQG